MSRIRYSPKSIQGAVAWMVFCTICLGGAEREPEHRLSQLERQAVEPQLQLAREQLQLELSVSPSPKLALFSSWLCGRSFFLNAFYPSSQHSSCLIERLRK